MYRESVSTDQERLNSAALPGVINTKVDEYSLIGGGTVSSTTIFKEHPTLLEFFSNIRSKSVSVKVDELSIT